MGRIRGLYRCDKEVKLEDSDEEGATRWNSSIGVLKSVTRVVIPVLELLVLLVAVSFSHEGGKETSLSFRETRRLE